MPKDVHGALHAANVDIRLRPHGRLGLFGGRGGEASVCVDPSRCSAAVVDAIPEHNRV